MNRCLIDSAPHVKHGVFFILGASLFLAVVLLVSCLYPQRAGATLNGFSAGNIMSDAVMGNKSTMSESQIQSFLKSHASSCTSKGPYSNGSYYIDKLTKSSDGKTAYTYDGDGDKYVWNIKNGHFVCMADDKFGGETAAHIIYRAAQDYHVNPQVLIVLLQKEQGLVTDSFPNNHQYLAATGYDCPDHGDGCNNSNAGFKTQIRKAALLYHEVLLNKDLDGDSFVTNYPVGNNYVQYNPDSSCGGSTINIKTRATSALYRYTPYQPNKAALAAGFGTAPCGAYGNRNFYNYFTDWFGSTYYTVKGAIKKRYAALGAENGFLGQALGNEIKVRGGVYQRFEGGRIFWSSKTGAWDLHGAIDSRYYGLGSNGGFLGYPTSGEISVTGGVYQEFQWGRIYWSSDSGAWSVHGAIEDKYISLKATSSKLGFPTSGEKSVRGGVYQQFEHGRVYWSKKTDAHSVSGDIYDNYVSRGASNGKLGYPVAGEISISGGSMQRFQGGLLYLDTATGKVWFVHGAIQDRYADMNLGDGLLGLPASNEAVVPGGVFQAFKNGRIYWSSKSGAWSVFGGMMNFYIAKGAESGRLGYPLEGQRTRASYTHQEFQGGAVFVKGSNIWVVLGGIQSRYKGLGAETSFLGYPVSGEISVPGGIYQQFWGGRIYWSNKTGARATHGAIHDKYLELGAESSFLGYPTSGEIDVPGGVYQRFEDGKVYWSGKTGAWSTHGAIQSRYLKSGGPGSRLGFPKSGELPDSINGGVYQKFRGGTIHWKPGWSPIYYY